MNTFRNFFVLACIAAILFAFLYAARPEWFSGIIASGKTGSAEMVVRKTTLTIPAHGRAMPTVPDDTDVRQLVDLEDEGLPSRVNAYVMIINTGDRTMRHYLLTQNVKSVLVRTMSPDVVVKKAKVVNTSGPVQLEIWITNSREITLDVEYQTSKG